ncbi:Pre (Mob) type recombination enzyme [Paracoccus aestuarii]|uniref:Pre (Mob) type recombination enzyme n=1 Tax=Paracoccus aestuarii TaxID=453842 RepID=A0A418ZZ89_9RHOB|nr:plasmid recombination protein [Paracoccus aestuarii]RJL05891.1 Pre (Mob) type recombination enzyme [Paracoccus aestuarii]WCQ98564.1 plasmid recombination protein [Paracoccus aestuarii]
MSEQQFAIVGRMEGLWPHQLPTFEMHRHRRGGDCGHVDPSRKNKLLHGSETWAAEAAARIDEIRFENYNQELAALEKRRRKTERLNRIVEGPRDPWRASEHGPMREMILTANKDFFASDLSSFFGEADGLEQQFEEVALAWLKQTFGDDLVHARADLDETSYHIHAVILPIETGKDGRRMVQPSKHAVIADYEHFQDEIGKVFAPLGLKRGEERAKAGRAAYARGETPPPPRRHVRPKKWREQEDLRLAAERAALEAAQAEQQRKTAEAEAALAAEREAIEAAEIRRQQAAAAAVAALEAAQAEQQRKTAEAEAELAAKREAIKTAEIRREQAAAQAEAALEAERQRLAEQAEEQDAILAAVEALGTGQIDPTQDTVTLAPAAPESAEATEVETRIARSPRGWNRFLAALTPGWQRLRQAAREEADAALALEKARVAREHSEIDGAWQDLAQMAREFRIDTGPFKTAKEQVRKVLARWRIMKARDAKRSGKNQGE